MSPRREVRFRFEALVEALNAEGRTLPRRHLGASVGLHLVLVVGLVVLPARLAKVTDEHRPVDVVFFTPAREPAAPIAPTVAPEPLPAEMPRQPEITVPPPPVVETPAPSLPRNTESKPPPVVRPPVARPARPAPEVRTDVFARERTPQPAPKPRETTTTGSFGAERTLALAPPRRGGTSVRSSGFAEPAAPAVDRPTDRTAAVVTVGFTGSTATRPAPAPAGAVEHAGFGAGGTTATPAARRTGPVASGGFADGAAPQTAPRRFAPPPETLDAPVTILSKPTPVYTDEARRLRVEGEVVLEVTFVATGRLRVLRVVRGLGHGLDEAATEAAGKIRFQPARRNGTAVDHTATLRVVFRLA